MPKILREEVERAKEIFFSGIKELTVSYSTEECLDIMHQILEEKGLGQDPELGKFINYAYRDGFNALANGQELVVVLRNVVAILIAAKLVKDPTIPEEIRKRIAQ